VGINILFNSVYNGMTVNKPILYYKGFFNYAIVNHLLKELLLLEQSGILSNITYKKIQIVMVEMLENSYKYTSEEIKFFNPVFYLPEFKILKENHSFRLSASNPIKKEDLPDFKKHLDKINISRLPELKEWYKKILKDEIYSKKQSPGIGLIRIAKVVRNKFEYTFQQIDNKFLYYTLDILINTK